jgi:peptidyl-tRNA hydrolase
VTPYVLGKPMTEEKEKILEAITRANVVLPQVLSGNMQKAMNDLH